MTLNPFCIAGGESGALTTHLYLQLSMAFREPRTHALTYMQVSAQMKRSTAQWREKWRDAEKQREEERN